MSGASGPVGQPASERTPLLASVARAQGRAPLPRSLRRAVSSSLEERQSSARDAVLPPTKARGLEQSRTQAWQTAAADRKLAAAGQAASEEGSRSFWYKMLRPHSHRLRSRVFRTAITLLIFLNVVAFVLQSEKYLATTYHRTFAVLEGISSCIFMLEYILRVWTVPERRRYAGWADWRARLSWMFGWESAVDLLATLPWFVEEAADGLCAISHKGCHTELPNFNCLRILRLFRLLKANSVVGAFDVVARVIYYNAEILTVALLICGVMILITATILFYLSPENQTDEDDFSSIPATMYLSVMMLTGQGQPGGVLPWYTKLIVVVTAIFSVAQFAIPASMLTWGFEAEAERRMKKLFEQRKKRTERLQAGKDLDPSSSSSDPEGSNSEWEEYEKLFADSGTSSESSESGRSAKARRAGPGVEPPERRPVRPTRRLVMPGEARPTRALPQAKERADGAPQLLLQVAGQLEALSHEVAELKARNLALEEENARLKGLSAAAIP